MKLDCAQRSPTSAKAYNVSQKWSGIQNQIFGLIRFW